MKVAYSADMVPPNMRRRVHKCDACGHEGYWDEGGWSWCYILVNAGKLSGWEYEWKLCSDACRQRDKDEKLYEKKKKQLNG